MEALDLGRDDADGAGDGAALAVDVAAKARQALDAEGQVELVVLLELLLLAFVQHAVSEPLRVLGHELLELSQRGQLAVHPELRVGAGRDVQIGSSPLDEDGQQIVHRGGHRLLPIPNRSRHSILRGARTRVHVQINTP